MSASLMSVEVLGLGRVEVFTALAVVATLATIGLLVVTVRQELHRRRGGGEPTPGGRPAKDPREALELVGNALAATHDPEALAPVIVRATVDATGALGGRLLEDGTETARTGARPAGAKAVSFPLGGPDAGTTLELFVPAHGFDAEARRLAEWLASQAAIALENARLHQVVQHQAATDELTGLVNRRRFLDAFELEIARADRFGSALCLVIADLDDFKLVNDTFGHPAGDELLRSFATTLGRQVRDIDVAARLGGEEFAVLLTETDLDGAVAVAERLRTTLAERPFVVRDETALNVTASFGVAQYETGESADELLRRADDALYRAKAAGKNRVISSVRS